MVSAGSETMPLPSREQCIELLKQHKNPEHIIEHSLQVERIANYLARKLKERGLDIDLDLVSRAALLHDIAKFSTLNSDIRHGKVGQEILLEKGYPKIAQISREHALSEILRKGALQSWESRVVYYADKRVNDNKIVSLEERFGYLRERYGKKSKEIMDTINSCYAPTKALEEAIFKSAGVDKSLSELK